MPKRVRVENAIPIKKKLSVGAGVMENQEISKACKFDVCIGQRS